MALSKFGLDEIDVIRSRLPVNHRIVFISGIFNTIHPGHARLFRYAKEQGDFVVVGVLDDNIASGAILSGKDRLTAVSSMAPVDYAFILSDRPEDLIASLQPSTVVKGLEFKSKHNPEKDVVEKYGGRLLFSSGETLFSSLELIRKDFLFVDHATIRVANDFLSHHRINRDGLLNRLKLIRGKKALVIGDTIVDEYISCDAVGLSREDPTVVVRPISSNKFIGGAGIVAAHARSLGGCVTFLTCIGKDEQGNHAISLLNDYHVEVLAEVDDTRPTTHKKRYRSQERTMLRVNTFSEIEISERIQNAIYDEVAKRIVDVDLIILSDFNYGILPQSLVARIAKLAKLHDVLTVADSQTSSQIGDISRYEGMTLVTPTEHEVRVALRDTTNGLAQISSELIKKSKCENLIVTLGADGIFMQSRDRDQDRWLTDRLPALNNLPRDPAGAGDALMVTAGLALASGANLWEAAYLGSIAAACQVSRLGNLPLTVDELIKEVERL